MDGHTFHVLLSIKTRHLEFDDGFDLNAYKLLYLSFLSIRVRVVACFEIDNQYIPESEEQDCLTYLDSEVPRKYFIIILMVSGCTLNIGF